MKNCINSGNVTNTGTAKSYAYCVGGISSTSSMKRCGNTGAISSTVKRTGGVVGNAAGQIIACFNLGDVTGIYSCGGAAGRNNSGKVTNLYNAGCVVSVGGITQSAPNGEDFLFSITEAEGYEYTVTLGDDTLEKNSDGKYTIAGNKLTGADVTVTVEKVGKIEIDASAYIELSGKTMWLVTASGAPEAGKVFAYDGNAMFWSEKYDAYCWLVVSDSALDAVKADAKEKIAAADAQKVSVQYDGDVNMTDIVDINDAQLTYDMYNAKYDSFDTVSMAKFLEADVNGDKLVNVTDAAAVIAKTLATA